ncbi:hypothetical protein MSAN_00922000 [Mycena sanguinolenta]|uniref:Uncharacterized protein n=1 Tax=Mycena sanguinolenta TaxID=230812 RepID=A0A8H7DCJ8_9AGAR|nr:hypothetical protein MSAN_00922000 [Mycena sanguinolenta]
MPASLFFWRRDTSPSQPSVTKEQGRRVDKAAIGRPVLRSLPRRYEIYAPEDYTPDPLIRSFSHRSGSLPFPEGSHPNPCPPAASFTPPGRDQPQPHYPLIRSYSLPTRVSSSLGGNTIPTFSAPPAARANSLSLLHLDIRRPLSPIEEGTCASPVSIQPTSPIKPTSPKDSDISTLELQQPVVCPPFVQRTISSRPETSGTTASNPVVFARDPMFLAHPPSLPPLDLFPAFPGPHPSRDGDGPPRRPPRVLTLPLQSTIYSEGARSSSGSLHAESFVTAADSLHNRDSAPLDVLPLELTSTITHSTTSSTLHGTLHASHSEPFPGHHLVRNDTAVSGTSSNLRLKRQHFEFATPAFCAFWLGFLFPPIWWIGGWYFTLFPETPASRTLWQHYVLDTEWFAVLTCGRRRRRIRGKHASHPVKPLLLPQWVKSCNNTTASLKGISYYYPYVSRPAPGEKGHVTTSPAPPGFRSLHKLFDEITRSRLARVKLDLESPRRIIDPWIQRCRRALCYFCLLLLLAIMGIMAWSFAVGSGKAHY